MQNYTERELKEIRLALYYHAMLNHGTDGHSRLVLISKLAGDCINPDVKNLVLSVVDELGIDPFVEGE